MSGAEPAPAPGLPWDGRAQTADKVILVAIVASGLYALLLIPVVPALVGSHPLLLELISGSTVATVTMGAFARVGEASLAVAVLAALPGCMMFDWAFWWAGRRWGHRALELMLGRSGNRVRARRTTARLERLAHRFGWLGVVLAYYLPVPSVLIYATAGLSGMRLRTFLLLDLLGTLLWIGMLVGLGYALGQRAVDVVHKVDHYSLYLSVGLIAVVIVLQARRRRA